MNNLCDAWFVSLLENWSLEHPGESRRVVKHLLRIGERRGKEKKKKRDCTAMEVCGSSASADGLLCSSVF